MAKPHLEEYSGEYRNYYETYISKTSGESIMENLVQSSENALELLSQLDDGQLDYCYAPGKWSIREMTGHLIDSERIFNYRALRIARGDTIALPGFDHLQFVITSNASNRKIDDLLEEMKVVRQSTILLFKSFTYDMLLLRGTANNNVVSVRAIGFIIPGHETHHMEVIKERYLKTSHS